MVGQITRKDGYLYGPWVRPRNLAANSMGSIHEDETARQYGMRGALVSGRLHLPAFAPLLAEVYGNDWFEHGTLFVEFRYGTLDQEEVRAVLEEPSEAAPMAPVQARLERPDGKLVARGSAAMGLICGHSTLPVTTGRRTPLWSTFILVGGFRRLR